MPESPENSAGAGRCSPRDRSGGRPVLRVGRAEGAPGREDVGGGGSAAEGLGVPSSGGGQGLPAAKVRARICWGFFSWMDGFLASTRDNKRPS